MNSNQQPEQDLPDLLQIRREKLERLQELGVNPFPYNYKRTHTAKQAIDRFDELEKSEETVAIAGRIMAIRLMGKSCFAHLQDASGRLQFYVKKDVVGEDKYDIFKLFDIGDHIGLSGPLFRTRTGEITVRAESFELLSKSLHPLPIVKEKDGQTFDAFADKEARYRQRYLDLVVNPEVRRVFEMRAKMVQVVHQFMNEWKFLDVETPILQPLYGGAAAEPFTTHHNVMEKELYLRIADELYLKRLIIGGWDRVYEMGKDFRNEGMDRTHNPEFTMLELYAAYEDYNFCMDLTEALVVKLAEEVTGSLKIIYEDKQYDLSPPWQRHRFFDLLNEAVGGDVQQMPDREIAAECQKAGLKLDAAKTGRGKLMDKLFGAVVEPNLGGPCFVLDYPVELSPLAKKHRTDEGLVERFEGFWAGREFCNSFSELNDPLDQRARFEDQAKLREAGDEESHPIDEDFLRALEIGMPPTAGLGIGFDRLVMFFTDQHSIRDVILFPQMR
ncbi:lysine--tRNA ligase [candidate division LCP-89 bacterium B3_LCP]|uniref:Lysine--tRNA ligase n=1 Tax=candidate division LCP-89 bacterium B3_LCP TaxID=2012998 RepID=A0A532URZ5_UNCL8|nr:MAG: lysine--tRNA ligase [candidate division LCP-89 bacterium B3_LCP]